MTMKLPTSPRSFLRGIPALGRSVVILACLSGTVAPDASAQAPAPRANAAPSQTASSSSSAPLGEPKEVANYRNEQTVNDYTRPSGNGFTLFLGVDAGYAATTPRDADLEAAKSGFQIGGKILGSLFTQSLALDIGGGYLHSQLSAAEGDKSVDPETRQVTRLNNVSITTRAGYAEASPRVRIGENWQLGVVGQMFFGTDVTFGPQDAHDRPTVLGGVQMNYVFGDDFQWRVGLQGFTDVNIYERDLWLGLVNIQFGIPIVKPKTVVTDKRQMSIKEAVQRQRVEKPVERVVIKEKVRFLFDAQMINFETDKAILSQRSDAFLSELGRYLVANDELWQSVVIEGHTDIRGSYEHNINLSRNRAASVRAALVQAGVPAGKLSSVGYGYTRPLDPGKDDVALARNRRVEMSFEGVRDANRLREAIDRIKANTRR